MANICLAPRPSGLSPSEHYIPGLGIACPHFNGTCALCGVERRKLPGKMETDFLTLHFSGMATTHCTNICLSPRHHVSHMKLVVLGKDRTSSISPLPEGEWNFSFLREPIGLFYKQALSPWFTRQRSLSFGVHLKPSGLELPSRRTLPSSRPY